MNHNVESILNHLITGELEKISQKDVLIASYYELTRLNDKVTTLDKKVDDTIVANTSALQILKSDIDTKLDTIEKRLKGLEQSHVENNTTIKTVAKAIGFAVTAILVTISVVDFFIRIFNK